ncbi:MAG: formyltetrahydrofolate deformylase [Balneolaceae bacterium]
MAHRILMIDCPDEKGLVYRITRELYDRGLNIISNHEFVDSTTGYFFMRTVVDNGQDLNHEIEEKLTSLLPEPANIRLTSITNRPVVVMATKESHCLGDLLLRNAYGELPSDIRAVVSNYDFLEPLVRSFNIPFHYVPHKGLERKEHEKKILQVLEPYEPEYLVLAKYMRIFSPEFVAHFPSRMVNIHHSFLPAFAGASPYKQAFDRGVKIIGATAHFVTEDLDEGPIIAQGVLPVNHSYTAEGMSQAGRDVEKNVLARALKMVLEERVFIYKDKTILFD